MNHYKVNWIKKLGFIGAIMAIIGYSRAQDYDVGDIQCSFSTAPGSNVDDLITARLKRPAGFKGAPLFADDRSVNPETDRNCAIKQDPNDPTELAYNLKITDFSRCGVLKRNGFVHVRIWFPQFPGVVMQSDQELIIMCKPPEPTVIENKAAGFAGSFPHGARVSGVVEETPGRLEYEVALYKEAPPIARISGANTPVSTTKDPPASSELPVDQAVPIGTKLQLRARISAASVWKYVKLMEVTVSPDPDAPHAMGAVSLVRDGCRNRDFATIIPHQPARYRDRHNEVFLDFEAFLLSSMKERATLWIHSQIKACMDPSDCQPDFCMDIYEPSGHGRKRRALDYQSSNKTEFTRFKENIEYTVIMPGEIEMTPEQETCRNILVVAGFLGLLLSIAVTFICTLAARLQMEQKIKMNQMGPGYTSGYAARTMVQ
ncbi:uncharacterized protein LOC129915923 [Episyrphus balteatus]|uniref:uncharacterized protein LOC129915923 n=1 Tax=Episyrphus balteatus TaxID=286459 RepID=UPI0024868888|nr:uncharacterized protein LOC129915923 [Episyrphus balteatus]